MKNYADIVLAIGLLFLASFSFVSGYFLSTELNESAPITAPAPIELAEAGEFTEIPIAAVYTDGEGVQKGIISTLTVELVEGIGRVLVNIDDIYAGTDTQESARIAVGAVERYLGIDFSEVDIIFTIESDAQTISGPSAGSAMAVALVLATRGEEINCDVAITGTISADGSLGMVDGVLAKAIAARESGYTEFLVPTGPFDEAVLEAQANIDIVEVANLAEALEHFCL